MNPTHLVLTSVLAAALATSSAHGQTQPPDLSSLKDKLAAKLGGDKNKTAPASTPTGTAPATPATGAPPTAPAAAAAPVLGTGPVKGTLAGQGAEMTTCEKMAKDPASPQWDVVCVKPTKTFAYKGSVTNVGATFRFNPPMTSRTTQFKVILFKNGVMDQYQEITFNTGGRTSQIAMTVTPGTYQMKLVDQFDTDKVALTDTIVVSPDTVGDRATNNVKSGIGKLMVCSEIDDNWKCLNESGTWAANQPFNLYVRLPQAIDGLTAGWAIFKQLPDGSDGVLVDDLLQGTNGRAAYWATTGGHRLTAGTYTIYSIAWANRTSIGNLKSYFAKTTLHVK
ncbi:hypothetical protein [Aquabacterium sp.]|uniref:hypothetical protein n=1 Tax=Aquabacterium sp. TaxID=1872578 RepID=UPI002C36E131|nr:hypothetical protein [Aquabacterium sp.]HSW03596.1 hypothetical protein [Aquabacterium sp.]